MNIYQYLFAMAFIIEIGILVFRLYAYSKIYLDKERDNLPLGISFGLFIVNSICWLLTLITFLRYPEEMIYDVLFMASSVLLPLNMMFFFIDAVVFISAYVNSLSRGRMGEKKNG